MPSEEEIGLTAKNNTRTIMERIVTETQRFERTQV